MTRDTIGFLEVAVHGPAHLVGWSDGANVALMVAMERPDLVEKLVLISSVFDVSGTVPELLEAAPSLSADDPELEFPRSEYGSISPDGPEHWPVVFEKLKRMVLTEPTVDPANLRSITAPTLVVAADDDIVRLEHTIELYRSVPDAQLAIVPGASHMVPLQRPGFLSGLVLYFLRNDPTTTLMPIRRRAHGPGQGHAGRPVS
jgi:pimeloyl-ACP methyl ester carboxylesterase